MNARDRSNDVDSQSTLYVSSTASIAEARQDAQAWLESLAVDESVQERAVLAISELVTNAVQATTQPFELTMIQFQPQSVRFEVSNPASLDAIPPRSKWRPEEVLSPRGRGLMIAESMSDRMEIVGCTGTVTARVEFDIST